jgi:hypothetical protein
MTKAEKAADRLEELVIIQKDIIQRLRANDPQAYALVYELRREVGYIVATLGMSVPKRSDIDWSSK